jgi:hypothetical protein
MFVQKTIWVGGRGAVPQALRWVELDGGSWSLVRMVEEILGLWALDPDRAWAPATSRRPGARWGRTPWEID